MEEINKLKIDLGPMWNEMELGVFLKIYRQVGLNGVQKMQDTLRQLGYFRSKTNLLSVYKKNKNFLDSNQNCTPHDLYLILRDHYEQNDQYQELKPTKKIKKNIQSNKIYQMLIDKKPMGSRFVQLDDTFDLYQFFTTLTCHNNNCIQGSQSIGNNFLKWLQQEHFYSHLDYTYFSLKEFQQLVNKAEIEWEIKTIKDWRIIKRAIGKPRRFSQTFISQEKEKLNKYRSVIRNYLFDQTYPIQKDIKNLELIHNIVRLAPFNVGQRVLAIHPICKHLHVGDILSTNLPTIVVRFLQPELGNHKISDSQIQLQDPFLSQQMSDDRFDMQQQLTFNIQNESKNSYISNIVQDLDHQATAFILSILSRKSALVNQLRQLSQQIQEKPSLRFDEGIKILYQWVVQQIQYFSQAQKNVLAKFRFRGLAGYQLDQVSQNIDKVLQTPVAYMEREVENNGETNEKRIQELKLLLKLQDVQINIFQDKINQQINNFTNSNFSQNDKENKYYPLIHNILGTVFTMNNGHDLNINMYWSNLQKMIERTHPTESQKIHENVQRIMGNQNK